MKIEYAIAFAALVSMLAFAASPDESDAAQQKSKATVEQADASAATSAQQAPPKIDPVSTPPPTERKLQYRPPSVGKPARSIGGGSRGVRDRVPVVYALVPDHVGQTRAAQPSLFWFIDQVPERAVRMEFTLLAEDQVEPVFESTLPLPTRAGIHRIRLADLGVELAPGTEYEWSVAVVVDPEDASKDVVATGWIDRVERPQLQARLDAAGRDGAVYVLAEEGLWYDALSELGDDLDRSPTDATLRAMQESLLQQVGLGALTQQRPM